LRDRQAVEQHDTLVAAKSTVRRFRAESTELIHGHARDISDRIGNGLIPLGLHLRVRHHIRSLRGG
jgi:hypothetical protein